MVGLRVPNQRNMDATSIYFLIFGVLTIIGGVIGYVKAGSLPSIIAGTITGVCLLIAGWILPANRTTGLVIGLIVSLLLAAQFLPKFLRTKSVMPAGLMSILSVIGIGLAIVAWLKK
ncbi:MAG TPA: TMEM14 family protein [Chthoniobacterales bacterium]|nr:TMEM14 family protein [Chthoniobacterales bacterium]